MRVTIPRAISLPEPFWFEMSEQFPVVLRPGAFWDPPSRKNAFDLILASKAVSNQLALEANLRNATQLAMSYRQGRLIATATIKCPQGSYRERVSAKSGIDMRGIDAEFGYVAVDEPFRDRRLATILADRLLDDFQAPVFATTGHPAMKKILARKGFTEEGTSWPGGSSDEPVALSLFLRR